MRSPFRAWLACLFLGVVLGFAADSPIPTLRPGSAAPDFDLPGVDGKRYTLASFTKSSVLVMVFTCNHCPTAQLYEERLKALATRFQPQGVALVAVSPNSPAAVRLDELGYTDLGDSLEDMKVRAKERGFNFPYLFDGDTEEMSRKYGPAATPHAFVFDRERKLRYVGRIDDSERPGLVKSQDLAKAVEALLAGRLPEVSETKVFGCSTKWNDKIDSNVKWRAKVAAEPVSVTPIDAAGLKELRGKSSGKVRVVNFWATWCGPCVSEFPDLVEMNLMYRGRDFEMVTVAAQFPDEKDRVLAFLKKQGASTRNHFFGDNDKYRLIEAFDPEWTGALPHTVVLSHEGKVLFRQTGEIDPLELRRKVLPALDAIHPWPAK